MQSKQLIEATLEIMLSTTSSNTFITPVSIQDAILQLHFSLTYRFTWLLWNHRLSKPMPSQVVLSKAGWLVTSTNWIFMGQIIVAFLQEGRWGTTVLYVLSMLILYGYRWQQWQTWLDLLWLAIAIHYIIICCSRAYCQLFSAPKPWSLIPLFSNKLFIEDSDCCIFTFASTRAFSTLLSDYSLLLF